MKKNPNEPRVYAGWEAIAFARRCAADAIRNPKNNGVADELVACLDDAERLLRARDTKKKPRAGRNKKENTQS